MFDDNDIRMNNIEVTIDQNELVELNEFFKENNWMDIENIEKDFRLTNPRKVNIKYIKSLERRNQAVWCIVNGIFYAKLNA